jgi:hypothetical protein
MADYYIGMTDIGMTLDGDLMVDDSGDLRLVEGFDWLSREVGKRIRTDNPSWVGHPSIGVGMSDFQGHPNMPDTAKSLRKRIKYVLQQDNISYPGEFNVRIVPIRSDGIMIFIYLDLAGSRVEIQRLIYDFSNGISQSMEESNTTYQPLPQEVKLLDTARDIASRGPNIYQERIKNQQ